jgi:hypothetical protein
MPRKSKRNDEPNEIKPEEKLWEEEPLRKVTVKRSTIWELIEKVVSESESESSQKQRTERSNPKGMEVKIENERATKASS